VLGNDLTAGGHGTWGAFLGYEGKADKVFYSANIGYMQASETWGDEEKEIGTEINAQVGYQLYDNLSISLIGAYCMLGDALKGTASERLINIPADNKAGISSGVANATLKQFGATDADDPYMVALQLSYTF
jgi:hypothetical protein